MAIACINPHFKSGIVEGAKTAGASLELLAISGIVCAIAVGCLYWNGIFLYSYTAANTVNLVWAIPITLIFVALDLFVVEMFLNIIQPLSNTLSRSIQEHRLKTTYHFRAVQLNN